VRRLIGAWHRLLVGLLVTTVAILVVPVTLQIVSRYTQLIPSYIWTEELSRFLFIWMVMIGAMVGVREGTHFEVDVWPELAPRPRAVLSLVSNLAVLVFALVFVVWGFGFVRFGWDQTSELAELPMPFIFVAWPLAGLTWVVFLGEHLIDNLLQLECYAGSGPNGQEEARELATEIRAALAAMSGTFDGAVVTGVRFAGMARVPDQGLEPARQRYILTAHVYMHP